MALNENRSIFYLVNIKADLSKIAYCTCKYKLKSCITLFICNAAFFKLNITRTSNLLRTNQTFKLTISDSCTVDYTVNFKDSNPVENLTNKQKTVFHAYASAGNYNSLVYSDSAPSGCQGAERSVEVRDPTQNMARHFAFKLSHYLQLRLSFAITETCSG